MFLSIVGLGSCTSAVAVPISCFLPRWGSHTGGCHRRVDAGFGMIALILHSLWQYIYYAYPLLLHTTFLRVASQHHIKSHIINKHHTIFSQHIIIPILVYEKRCAGAEVASYWWGKDRSWEFETRLTAIPIVDTTASVFDRVVLCDVGVATAGVCKRCGRPRRR